ncbi:MAG: hypothetical protein WCO84_01780 [bacterium]
MKKETTIDDLVGEIREVNKNIDQLAKAVLNGFESVDKRFESIDKRFDIVDSRLNSLESDVSSIKTDISSMKVSLDGLHKEVFTINNRMEEFEEIAIIDHGKRIKNLELATS